MVDSVAGEDDDDDGDEKQTKKNTTIPIVHITIVLKDRTSYFFDGVVRYAALICLCFTIATMKNVENDVTIVICNSVQ